MRCRILSMAYRNHPTRYLIVKDRVAQATRRRFRRLAGGGKLFVFRVPVKHFFFKTRSPVASGPRCRFACGGELLRFPASPVNTFFQLRFAFQRPVRFRFPEAEVSFYARPPGPSTFFFTQLEVPLPFDPRCGFPQRAELNSRACDACQLVFSIIARFLSIPGLPTPVSRSGRGYLGAPAAPVKSNVAVLDRIFQNIINTESLR